jgi:hypothetical protein
LRLAFSLFFSSASKSGHSNAIVCEYSVSKILATLRTMHYRICGEDYVVRQNVGFLLGLVRACGRMELSEW